MDTIKKAKAKKSFLTLSRARKTTRQEEFHNTIKKESLGTLSRARESKGLMPTIKKGEGKMGKRNEVKYFTREERERFMRTVEHAGNNRDLVMFKLFLSTGLRISELNSLTVGHLRQGLSYGKLVITGKGNKTRTIPLVNGINNELERFLSWKQDNSEGLHPNSPIFCNYKGKKITNRGIQDRVKHYCLKVGIRELSPHSFRHTVGFTMGNSGEPIQVIQKLLGHSNLNTTRIYVEPDLDQITASMSRSLSG